MKRKNGIMAIFLGLIFLGSLYFAAQEWRQQKRKEALPPEVWASSLSEASKDLFVKGICNEKEISLLKKPGFDETKLEEYARYREFSDEQRIRWVNNATLNPENATILLALSKDPYFIEKELVRYLAHPMKTARETVEYINCGRDKVFYKDTKKADISKNYLVNVNKYYQLGADYVPEDLVAIDPVFGFPGKIRKPAYAAYQTMLKEAQSVGLNFEIISAYRSYQRQVELFQAYSGIDGESKADTYSARPGFSDHQTGLAIDVMKSGYDFDTFYASKEAEWLAKNAPNYGFIVRYPKDKETVTGYTYEPWHLRYIGKQAAKEIAKTGLCFDEYYRFYVEGH